MTAETGLPAPGGHPRLLVAIRGVLLALCTGLAAAAEDPARWVPMAAGLLAVATAASVPVARPSMARWLPVGEAALVTSVVMSQTPINEAFLPYLFAPALAAGLMGGVTTVVMALGSAAAVVLVRVATAFEDLLQADFVRTAAEWLVLSLAAGILAAWVRRLPQAAPQPEVNASYAAAYRLLSQLRLVSRQLSEGLDPVSLGQALLQRVGDHIPYTRAGVFVRSRGGRLVPLVLDPTEPTPRSDDDPPWDAALDDESAFAESWSTGEPVARPRRFDGTVGTAVVLPLRVGVRSIGLVGLETDSPVADLDLRAAMGAVEEATLRIETALLFGEVRSIATAEERRRLAREIHDGIAQELASLGYVVDDVTARARRGEHVEEPLRALRAELTRIIGELRLSIFDLRSDVQPHVGLGAALSDYVRAVGAGSALTVNLTLDESPARLRVESETELMRIAQEAITNARKHADASTLWVTCRVDPPRALLRVEDDGRGLGPGRIDSFGLEIMRERAARLGARLDVHDRAGGGTVVEVVVGSWNGGPQDHPGAASAGRDDVSRGDGRDGVGRVHDRTAG